jgi:hypothetical protein
VARLADGFAVSLLLGAARANVAAARNGDHCQGNARRSPPH